MVEGKGVGSESTIVGYGAEGSVVAESKAGRCEGSFGDIWHCSDYEMKEAIFTVLRGGYIYMYR